MLHPWVGGVVQVVPVLGLDGSNIDVDLARQTGQPAPEGGAHLLLGEEPLIPRCPDVSQSRLEIPGNHLLVREEPLIPRDEPSISLTIRDGQTLAAGLAAGEAGGEPVYRALFMTFRMMQPDGLAVHEEPLALAR